MKKLAYIIILISMVLLIGGVILTVLMLLDNETVKNITLDKDGHADEELMRER